MPGTPHALPESLLGQLQRGRGLGHQRLLQEPRPVAHRLLTQCILADPRLDYLCENRGDYYAELARRVELPLGPLAARIREDDGCDEQGLTWQTLRSLSRQGSREATEILLEDCRTYEDWPNHVEALVSFPDPGVSERLARIIDSRFPTASALHKALRHAVTDGPGWQMLGQQSVRMREALTLVSEDRDVRRREATAVRGHLATLDLRGLLAWARSHQPIFGLRPFIEAAAGPDDVTFLQSQVLLEHREQSVGALWGLAKIADPAFFDWLRDTYVAHAEMSQPLRIAFQDAMAALPAQVILPLARQWLDHPNIHFSTLADQLLKTHSTPQDLPLLQVALRRSLGNEPHTSYRLCVLAMAIERLEDIGHVPELDLAFETALHSCARWYLVPAMRSTDPGGFQERFAAECLWDCEEDVQLAGVEMASLDAAGVFLRLNQLASGSWVDSEVREAASRRLGEVSAKGADVGIGPR